MNKIIYSIATVISLIAIFASCSKQETYAEQREREFNKIDEFISKNKIEVIDEATFKSQDYTTKDNQYVQFNNTGVYMNIIDKGPEQGKILSKNGDNAEVLVRYQEYNINGDSIKTTNRTPAFATLCDKFSVNNYQGTYIASFIYGRMYNYYGSTTVPGGWLVPLKYIRLGRPVDEDDHYATVRLIVPHDQGTAAAVSGVYACYYYMTYEVDR